MASKAKDVGRILKQGPPAELVQRLKQERAKNIILRRLRWRNALVASSVLGFMGAIFFYTLKVTKQEHFLDKEFDSKPGDKM